MVKAALLGSTSAAGKPIEIWFQDEARIGLKGTHAYIFPPVGSCPLMVRDHRHDSAHLFGAVCPQRGVSAAIIMSPVNIEAMSEHLKEISAQVAEGAHAVMVLDDVSWHQAVGTCLRCFLRGHFNWPRGPVGTFADYARNPARVAPWSTYLKEWGSKGLWPLGGFRRGGQSFQLASSGQLEYPQERSPR